MHSVTLKAHAKINWTLDITGTDDKNYHLLDMLMQSVSLFDKVEISKSEKFSLKTNIKYIPCDKRNTAYVAAHLFYERIGIEPCCSIRITKNIPSGAGMGGGSADAAAVLNGLNMLYGYPIENHELKEMALKIGADVPFMLEGGMVRATGIGEKTEKIENKKYYILLAMNQSQPASTKLVYKVYDELDKPKSPDTDAFIDAYLNSDFDSMRAFGGNVLQPAAVSTAPDIPSLIERMYENGAEFASMTGSGSVVFGVFKNLSEVLSAKKNFGDVWSKSVVTSWEEI